MRLVTVNLYNGRVVPRDLERFLDDVRPDTLCAQEVGPDAGRVLERRFPHGAVSASMDFDGRALVSTRPMHPTPVELPFRGGFRAGVDLDGTEVEVITVHLANPLDGLTGIAARRAQLEGIERELSTLAVGVLVGDMNATPSWPAYRRILSRIPDGVAEWADHNGVRAPATWAKSPSWPALLRIDHVFTRGIDVASARVERIAGLDHRAVVTDLRIGRTS